MNHPTRRSWETADTVIAISLLLLVCVFAVFGFLVWQAYGQTLERAQDGAQRAADVAAAQAELMIGAGLALIDARAASLYSAPPIGVGDAGPPPLFRSTEYFAVYDADGRILPAFEAGELPENLAERPLFRRLASATGTTWAASLARYRGPDEQNVLLLGRNLTRNGAFAGIAAVQLREEPLISLASSQDLGHDGLVILAYSNGDVISSCSFVQEAGRPAITELLPPSDPGESGAYTRYPDRIAAFRRIPGLDLIAIASASRAAALDNLWTAARTVLLLMGPIALGLFVASVVVARLLRRSERTRRELAAALEQNQVLFREIHHRIKNNLQSIAALLRLQPIPPAVKVEMEQRIAAMSAVHEHLYRSDDFRKVRIKAYLETLLKNIAAGQDPAVRIEMNLEDLMVDRDAATPLGLVLNEVLANAYKHAFAGQPGVISVTVTANGDGQGELTIADNGVGFDPDAPTSGIGRRLVSAFTAQLGGRFAFDRGAEGKGTRFTLTFPLAA